MIALWLAGAAWGLEPSTAQTLAELEWRRADPLSIVTQMAGADAETRVLGVRALGRLRDPEALQALTGFADDPAEPVRVAVAEALGATPGATDLVRDRLARLVPPAGPGPRAAEADGEMAALLDALGRQGTARELGPVLDALREPWPIGAAAARALGRMGVRRVPALDETVPPLVARLGATDPRLVADVAWALSRIGLTSASHAEVQVVWRRMQSGTMPETRAWLVKAVWPVLAPEQRDVLFLEAATEPSRLVRVALFTALRKDDVGGVVIAPFLTDPDPWVRSAVIDALGRIGDAEAHAALTRHADESDDPYEVAAAIAARGTPAPELASDPKAATVLRAAAVSTLTDVDTLVRLALEGDQDAVRSAAAAALLDDEHTPGSVGVRLLQSSDEAVHEAAVELVGRLPPKERAKVMAGVPADVPVQAHHDAKLSAVRQIRSAVVTTSEGTFRIALDPETAPLAVSNFAALAEAGFFDGLVWHRVVPGFVVQTGCPRGDGWGGPGYVVPDEVSSLPFATGAVGMARAERDTGGSQWFVTTSDQPHLVGEYTRFGEVVDGLHVVRRLKAGSLVEHIEIERLP